MGEESTAGPPSPLDLKMDQPHTARIYDYFLGGKAHYEADRAAGDKVMALWPAAPVAARTNRAFMRRACRLLAAEYGMDQFLDIGTGIPTEPNLHQVVQRENPRARVVYVDNDPIVLAHARALMSSSPEGRTAYLHASIAEPDRILRSPEVADTLDLSRPLVLSVLALLHFVPDTLDAYGIIERLVSELPSGSALLLTHGTADFAPEAMGQVGQVYSSRVTPVQSRSRTEFAGFFAGLELVEPGIELPHKWRPDDSGDVHVGGGGQDAVEDGDVALWAGLAFKP
jgi:hypothetical protein